MNKQLNGEARALGKFSINPTDDCSGLTLREYFAGLAMQGVLAGFSGEIDSTASMAKCAVQCADALLEELCK